jgi:hypothetical protein
MVIFGSIFSDFKLPTAATWFYFSMLLAVALFFKFSRLLSVRNWDVVTVFLLVPGLLLLQESRIQLSSQVAGHLGWTSQTTMASGLGTAVVGSQAMLADPSLLLPTRLAWLGYLWLVCGSAYFLIRCLIDLALVRRPALPPNLNLGGMAWLGAALFGCLVSVAARQYEAPPPPVGKTSPTLQGAEQGLTDLVNQQNPAAEVEGINTHFIVACTLAMLCHLAVCAGLVVIGYRVFQDPAAGMAAATFYLLLPYTAMHVGQVHHVWPSALLVWAVVFYRRPMIAGLLLGLAAGSVYFPALLFPVWFSFYWGRGAWRFAAAFVISAFIIFVITGLTLDLTEWQAWKAPTGESIWKGIHWAYRIPVFIAFLAFVIATFFWPSPKNLAHVLALSAAVLIGIQFWYAEQGGVYVLWYLPLMLLLVFRPNLSDRQPLAIPAESDWLLRLGRKLRAWSLRLLNLPQPTTRVH